MKPYCILVLLAFLVIQTGYVHGNEYLIGKDENGIYIQTDRHGSWYPYDSGGFRVGERGDYALSTDHNGTYIQTDRYGRFYIDTEENEQMEHEIRNFNQDQEKQFREKETKIHTTGNQVLVPVVLGYGAKTTEVMLLLDTGASVTVLHREIAEKLGLKMDTSSLFQLAGGETMRAATGTLTYLKVGPFTKKELTAGIFEHKGPPVSHQGLLGMDVLKDLKYRIDFERGVIVWTH